MATSMTDEELERLLPSSKQIDEYCYRNDEDEDDYVVAVLYETPDGRKFRHIESSGFNSGFDGSGNIGEWLDGAEADAWKTFYP